MIDKGIAQKSVDSRVALLACIDTKTTDVAMMTKKCEVLLDRWPIAGYRRAGARYSPITKCHCTGIITTCHYLISKARPPKTKVQDENRIVIQA